MHSHKGRAERRLDGHDRTPVSSPAELMSMPLSRVLEKLTLPVRPGVLAALLRLAEFSHNVVPCHQLGRLEAEDNAFALSYWKQLVILLVLCFQERLGF
jgi:hypothetical protein